MSAPIDVSADSLDLSDADLLSAARSGDADAYGLLFSRHREAAERMSRSLLAPPMSDDLVQDSFVKIWDALRSGKGPTDFFRAYLLTTIRRLHVDTIRLQKREQPVEHDDLDASVDFEDVTQLGFERGATANAFRSLPERWQLVLWHLDVEGQKPAEVATLLGMKANAVSALAYRAREGLRQAYLQQHLVPGTDRACQETTNKLGAYVRNGLSRRDKSTVEAHLDDCRSCTGLAMELREYNGELGAILGPAVLGAAVLGYLPTGSAAAGVVGLGALGSAKKFSQSSGGAGTAGAAGSAAAAGGIASAATTIGIATAVVAAASITGLVLVKNDSNDAPTNDTTQTVVAAPPPPAPLVKKVSTKKKTEKVATPPPVVVPPPPVVPDNRDPKPPVKDPVDPTDTDDPVETVDPDDTTTPDDTVEPDDTTDTDDTTDPDNPVDTDDPDDTTTPDDTTDPDDPNGDTGGTDPGVTFGPEFCAQGAESWALEQALAEGDFSWTRLQQLIADYYALQLEHCD